MKFKEFNWIPGLFIIGYHLGFFVLVPIYLVSGVPSGLLIGISAALLFISGISISAGYHRFYSHKAYTPSKFFESMLLFFGTMAFEGSALYWSHEHRIHHRFTDTDQDPHSIKKGFMHAHMLWLFRSPRPIDLNSVKDLAQNKLVMFQHKYYGILAAITNLGALYITWLITGDLFGVITFALVARVFLLHHFTWFINSLAHTMGAKTYSGEQTAVDNYLIALVTFGEGYHNYHHVFASDYRNGVKWYHFDPSKWLIWTMNKLGLAKDLKKMNPVVIKRAIITEDRKILLEKLNEMEPDKKSIWETKIQELSEALLKRMVEISRLVNEYSLDRSRKKELKMQLKQERAEFSKAWDNWVRISREITKLDKKSDFKYINSAA